MTNEELLARIKEKGSADFATLKHNADGQKNIQDVFGALRAVVELHKPHDEYEGVCSGCYEEESGFSDYPCPTIQAIEKDLG